MQETAEKVLIPIVVFVGAVALRFLFKEFRESSDPAKATEVLIRRLLNGQAEDKAEPPPRTDLAQARKAVRGRLVTVFAEGASDAGRKLGAWSAWARDGVKTVQRSGVLKKHIHTRDHASVEAMAEGIHLVVESFDMAPGALIVAQSSSEHAVDVLSGRKPLRANRTEEAATVEAVGALSADKEITLSFKHIHDPGGDLDKRTRASLLCERQAQRELDRRVAEIEAGEQQQKRA